MSEYRVSQAGGGKTIPKGALFSRDGRHYIVPFNNQLRVYFITTRQCIRSLKFNEENQINFDNLVTLKEDLNDPNSVWAFNEDGEVLIINWKEKGFNPVLKRLQLAKSQDDSILKIVQFNNDSIVAITGKNSPKAHTRNIIQYNLNSSAQSFEDPIVLTSIKNVTHLNVSNDATKIALFSQSNASKTVTTIDLNDTSNTKTTAFGYKSPVTSLAVSDGSIVAVGTAAGVIHLVYENTTRLLKWHIDQVKSLVFSQDSNYLLSGGLEKVLVFWQLDTEKQQFLPRLNGEIVDINNQIEEYYTLTLKLDNQENYEILVLSSLDLQSRLVVSGPRQVLQNDVSNLKKIAKIFQKEKETDVSKLRYDFTSSFKIHPVTKQLYFINGSNLQAFDFFKSEQGYVQKITDTLQIGKVRSESKLLDPNIKQFAFTNDGKWLATTEEHHHGEIDNLLSKNDHTYVLKIWKSNEIQQSKGAQANEPQVGNYWELVTKIINPHGEKTPVLSVLQAPSSFYKGIGFITADNNGGVRLWRPTVNGSGWSLRKLKASTGIISTNASLTWSLDSSLIFLGFDTTITVIDSETFEEIESPETQILATISESKIRFLEIVDNNLIILTKTSLKSIDLLTLKQTGLFLKVNSPREGENLIAVDHERNLVVLAVNFFNLNEKKPTAKVFVFKPTSNKPVSSVDYPDYISSISWSSQNEFTFIDINSKICTLSNSKFVQDDITSSADHAQEMSILLKEAQSTSAIYRQNSTIDNSEELNGTKSLDINSFSRLFESIDGIQIDTLFERVVQIVN